MLAQTIDSRLRRSGSVAERDAFLAAVQQALDVPSSAAVEETTLPLTWAEIHEMERTGWVSFGAHTMHHPILAYLLDPAEVQREVGECRTILAQQLGHPVRIFAYPVGKPEHIGEAALRAVREAGYEWAVTTMYGINTPQSNPHQLRRVAGDVTRHWLVMAAEVSGLWKLLSPLWKNPLIGRIN
jgi:peptidoglycan/xylan/chitin deacetylase (PgdA/CDA1 family)